MRRCRKCATEIAKEAKNQVFCNPCNPWSRNFKPIDRDALARERKRERMEGLKRKYHDVPFHHAVMNLFWREGRLTMDDIATILETDDDTVKWEIDKIRQDAR